MAASHTRRWEFHARTSSVLYTSSGDLEIVPAKTIQCCGLREVVLASPFCHLFLQESSRSSKQWRPKQLHQNFNAAAYPVLGHLEHASAGLPRSCQCTAKNSGHCPCGIVILTPRPWIASYQRLPARAPRVFLFQIELIAWRKNDQGV
jgi:hypothetical protein